MFEQLANDTLQSFNFMNFVAVCGNAFETQSPVL
jgi:hypothetical protein